MGMMRIARSKHTGKGCLGCLVYVVGIVMIITVAVIYLS